MKRTYLPTDGVSLASIVANGTHNNDWNGAGVGVGSGGLVVGGAAGQSISRSELAKIFDVMEKEPERMPANYNLVAIPMFFILLFVLTDAAVQNETYRVIIAIVLIVLGIVCTAVYGIYFSDARDKEINEENARLKREYELKKAIYYRLRFLEADFVVFDPVTGYWDYAEKAKLISLIYKIKAKNQ
ncbi:hypothetical protein JEP98_18770 [Providencia rettgeri]|uniref:hypothetical protein n=1 Tax=Providencia rettgeri TaxID=587 RepID=UPI0018E40587|nr:hypothetical protein [Providencia rettgeri]MBI6191191.1 hypothetical protein [Providencia rettgeri]